MSSTISKPRSSTRSALDELAKLDAAVETARDLPFQLDQQRKTAAGDLAIARGRLQGYYATAPADRDESVLEQLALEANAAEAAASKRWDDERLGLEEALLRTVDECERWIDANFGRLVAEVTRQATELRDDTVRAAEALKGTTARGQALAGVWQRILGEQTMRMSDGKRAPRRLIDIDVYQGPHDALAIAEIQGRLARLVSELGNIDLANLRRQMPYEFDIEGNGQPPAVNS